MDLATAPPSPVLLCATEFIHLVAFEANDTCDKGKKKTIGQEHVVEALKTLGFESYIPEVAKVVGDAAEEAKVRHSALWTLVQHPPCTED